MSRVTSLTSMPEAQLNRWIKRLGLLFLVALVAFVAFYAVDRFKPAATPMADQRLAQLEEAVRIDPSDGVARGQLADMYYVKRRFEDAIGQYTALIDAKVDVELASLGRGNSYRQLEQYDQAVADYNVVIDIAIDGEMANVDPSLEAAYFGLGTIALAQDRPADAIDQFKKALAIIKTDADALNGLATAYLATDQTDLAVEPLELAIALVPIGWGEPYANLASAYGKQGKAALASWANAMAMAQAGDVAGARSELLKLVDGDAALKATIGLGILEEEAGNSADAADWYRKALVIDSENVSARMGLQRVTTGPAAAAPSGTTEGSN
jgi:tetratricopeptide (TPR) repeat protein